MDPAPATPTQGGRTAVFAGGGTGGHIFPALAVAAALRERRPDVRVLFLCSEKPVDAQILSAAGVAFAPIPARPLSLRPAGLARLLRHWPLATRLTRELLEVHGVDEGVLIATGGYVAGPPSIVARQRRMPILLVNLDATPGRANRWIGAFADRCVTAAEGAAPKEWLRTGPIVRPEALPSAPPDECRRRFGLDPDRPTLLVTGGSLGARSLNEFVLETARRATRAFEGWQVLHQCGKDAAEACRAAWADLAIPAHVTDFIVAMGEAWGAADLSVTRAGAGTVAEAWATRTPCLMLPYPYHRDAHQRLNAAPLERAGGAIVVTDRIEAAANASEHAETLTTLLLDHRARARMMAALSQLGSADGAGRVAEEALALLDRVRR